MSHTNKTPPAIKNTLSLPRRVKDGTVYYDTTADTSVVFKNGAWRRSDDGSMHRRVQYDLYIFAGQSNCGGHGNINTDLTTNGYHGTDLSLEQTDVLFQINYHQTRTQPQTTHVYGELGSLKPGSTSGNNMFGAEISFADRMKNIQQTSGVAVMKYYVDGSGINKFDKANSNQTDSNNANNAWDGLVNSLADIQNKAKQQNVILTVKGMIWFQGESDIAPGADVAYEQNLETFLSNVREHVGDANLPVVIIESQNAQADTTVRTNFETSVQNVVDSQQYTRLVETSHLINRMPDHVHWAGAEHIAFGKQAADQMKLIQTGERPFVPSDLTQISSWYDMSDSTDETSMTTSQDGAHNKVSIVRNKIEWNTCDLWQSTSSRQPVVAAGGINGLDALFFDNITTDSGSTFLNHSSTKQWMATRARTSNHGWWGSPFSGESNNGSENGQTGAKWPTYADADKKHTMGMLMVALYPGLENGQLGGTTNGVGPIQWAWARSLNDGEKYYRAYLPLTQNHNDGGGGVYFNHTPAGGNLNTHGHTGAWTWRYRTDEPTVYSSELTKTYFSVHKDFDKPTSSIKGESNIYVEASPTDIDDGYATRNVQIGNKHYMVGEILYYNDTISDEDFEKLEGYLAHKWGLLDLLPSNHTYKTTAPVITI